jgi:hypothetical protein
LCKEKTDYLMLEALQFHDINNTGYFVGVEHPIHCRFEELNRDVSSSRVILRRKPRG